MELEQLWVKKYNPNTLDDMVLDMEVKKVIQAYIDKKTMTNLLLAGRAGIGKTSLATVIVKELDATYMYLNASVENGVDTIRFKVREFCNSVAIGGGIKLVILDEADGLSSSAGSGASAQDSLRQIIEESSTDTRFILTCNYLNKIIEPIKSRCVPLRVRANTTDVANRCATILVAEKIKFDKETFMIFVDKVIKELYPDIRSIINNLERWCVSGEMKPTNLAEQNASDKAAEDVLSLLKRSGPRVAREWCIANESLFSGDYEILAGKLFDALKDPAEQLMCAEHLYRMGCVIDKEIQFAALLLKLGEK